MKDQITETTKTVTRKSGKLPIQIKTKSSCNKRFSDDEYSRIYSEDLHRSGYCYKLPVDWRKYIQIDSVLWFINEGTEFIVGSNLDALIWSEFTKEDLAAQGSLWFMVCCPIQPSILTREETNKYWQDRNGLIQPAPEYPRFIDYLDVQDLPIEEEFIKGVLTKLHVFDRRVSLGLRFQPQYKVLVTMEVSNDPAFDLWVARNLVSQQVSCQQFFGAATKKLFRLLREEARKKAMGENSSRTSSLGETRSHF